jgi:hypothetical protein
VTYISSYPSWQLDIGNAYIVNDGRAKVECRFPDGSWTLAEFAAMVEKATAEWDEVTINWSEDTGGGNASFWVIALRQPTAEDLHNIEEWKRRAADRHQKERDWHTARIADLTAEGKEAE